MLIYRDQRIRWLFASIFPWIVLFLLDAALSTAIVLRVPYTEIDWVAYMQQIGLYNAGETDYSKIYGGTGPLVYPGGHVLIFQWLHAFTDGGKDIRKAQWIYLGVYLTTLAVTMSIYRRARVSILYGALLILSKRLHSIYLLRLFNDCFTTLFVVLAVRVLQERWLALSALFFSLALSVKMSAALYLPGAAIVYWNELGVDMIGPGIVGLVPQILVAFPFREHLKEYTSGAFDFSRQFLYKWTVNWRFVDEVTFLSRRFARSLLVLHVSLLSILANMGIGKQFTPRSATRIVAVANLIGVLCARSLHYQFYSWFYWTVPLLLADLPLIFLGLWALLEYAWLVFPSTNISSGLNLVVLSFLVSGGLLAVKRSPRRAAPARRVIANKGVKTN